MVKKVTVVHWEDSEGVQHKTERDAIMSERLIATGVGVRAAVEKGLPDALRKSGNGKLAVREITSMLMSNFHMIPMFENSTSDVRCSNCNGTGWELEAGADWVMNMDNVCVACKGSGLKPEVKPEQPERLTTGYSKGVWWADGAEVGVGPTMGVKIGRIGGHTHEEAKANAARIVLCIMACGGLSESKLRQSMEKGFKLEVAKRSPIGGAQ